ncbi:MAG: hypothetical protein JNK51_06915 [Blastocatellia bacterium]|nr:hypothetical protein [Chloracidobacterium sp.]MBL8184640.1 hypothetical protein [Blastocatellia bacterium]HBE81877.1 hypothetical protein [Blastocatellia bacterium]HRJ87285.1 hypothetical protein [Pyrinomonadaceae bacterium]HRK52204.1 hypothetical protein [Pyrinomonadaceae bacterium]
MKSFIRFAGMAALLAAFVAIGSTVGYAQNCEDYDGNAALDAKIRESYPKDATLKVAVESGKQYLEKYGSCEVFKDFSDWLKVQVPKWEERVKFLEAAAWLKERFARFDNSVKSQNYDDAFAAGGEIIAKYPVGQTDKLTGFNSIDQAVTLGLIGLPASYSKNFKNNDQSLKYANIAIAELKAGGKATKQDKDKNDVFGIFQFERSRQDAISELTYTIGFIKYWDKGDKKGGLASFYETSQLPGSFKSQPALYATIGEYYRDEALKITEDIRKMIKDLEAATTDEEKLRIDGLIKGKEALFNGYAERAMDAYGRAHSLSQSTTPDQKKYKDALYATISGLYELRFQKKDGVNTWLSSAVAKPMPNPTTEVEPIKDPEPTTTTTTTSTTGASAVSRP